MTYRGDYYNASGAADPTAYFAIKSADKEKRMANITSTPLPGEIWKYEGVAGKTEYMLAIHNNGKGYTQGLTLTDTPSEKTDIEVNLKPQKMYTDSGRINFVYDKWLIGYYSMVSEDELGKAIALVKSSLGFAEEAQPVVAESPVDRTREIELAAECKILREMNDKLLGHLLGK